jgi:hypothetical protein
MKIETAETMKVGCAGRYSRHLPPQASGMVGDSPRRYREQTVASIADTGREWTEGGI